MHNGVPRPAMHAPSRHVVLTVLLAALPDPAAAQAPSFHTPDEGFEPVTIPEWVWESTRIAYLGEDRIDMAAAAGVQVVHGGGPWPYHPLVRDDPASGLPPAEKKAFAATVAKMKERGMRVVMGIAPFAPPSLVKLHPEWILRDDDGAAIEEKARLDLTRPENYRWRLLCLGSPWGDYLIECLAEILRDYKLDGFSFDGNYLPALCRCASCKEAFAKAAGRSLPARVDLHDLEYREYMLWAGDRLESWYRRLHDRMRQVNPESVLNSWTVNAGRYGHLLTSPRAMPRRMNLLFECPMQEWWLDETNLGGSIVPAFGAAYVKACTGHRVAASEPYLMSRGNPYGTDSFPRREALARALLILTNGSLPAFSFGWPGHAGTAVEVMKEVGKRSEWLVRAEPMPWAALLVSEETRQFYGLDRIAERYLPHVFGAFRAAFEEHLAVTLITEWDLRPATLSRYGVLVLPNAACLSEKHVQVIREYVAAGGGLVATSDTSLFDELGRPRGDFALGDVFGVKYEGKPAPAPRRGEIDANFAIAAGEDYWKERAGAARLRWGAGRTPSMELVEDPALLDLVPGGDVSFKGPLAKVSAPREPMRVALEALPEGASAPLPAAVLGERGKGRAAYLAAGIDAAYWSYWYPYQRRLLARAIRWAAREPFAIDVKAPMCVQATFFQQAGAKGRRAIVHLFNDVQTTANHGRPEVEVPLREEGVPVAGIEVLFRGLPVRRVHLEPGAMELDVVREGDTAAVRLPPLDLHAMVVAELE